MLFELSVFYVKLQPPTTVSSYSNAIGFQACSWISVVKVSADNQQDISKAVLILVITLHRYHSQRSSRSLFLKLVKSENILIKWVFIDDQALEILYYHVLYYKVMRGFEHGNACWKAVIKLKSLVFVLNFYEKGELVTSNFYEEK